jgi:hypothetical protein
MGQVAIPAKRWEDIPHCPMGPWKGMSIDNTVQFEVVTGQLYALVNLG